MSGWMDGWMDRWNYGSDGNDENGGWMEVVEMMDRW